MHMGPLVTLNRFIKYTAVAAGYQISNTNTTSTLESSSTIPGNSGIYTCYYSSYPDPVRVFIRVNVTEKGKHLKWIIKKLS